MVTRAIVCIMHIIYLLFASFISFVFCGSYSIGFTSIVNETTPIVAQVYVNSVESFVTPLSIDVPYNTFAWYNFTAQFNDSIQVEIQHLSKLFRNYYVVNNGPNGTGATIFDSRSLTFSPVNICTDGPCRVLTQASNYLTNGDNMTFFVNGVPQKTNFTGQPPFTLHVNTGDSIFFNYQNSTEQVPDFYVLYEFSITKNIKWYTNTYATFANIPNSPLQVNFTLPQSGAYPAGSVIQVQLYSYPTAENFFVTLTCPNLSPINTTVTSNTGYEFYVAIPSDYYGDCVFEVTEPASVSNTVNITITQEVQFTLPSASKTYYQNTPIPVLLSANVIVPNNLVTVTQACSGVNPVIYENVTIGTEFKADPPVNYTGSCTFTSSSNGVYLAANPPVNITIIEGTLQLNLVGQPSQIAAGTDAEVFITATPDLNEFKVRLNCGRDMQTTELIQANTSPQSYPIPESFYGSNCTFAIIDYPSCYGTPNTINLTVTQQLIFESPENHELFIRFAPLPILLKSGYLSVEDDIALNLVCVNVTTIAVKTNVLTSYSYSNDTYGSCTLSVASAPNYYVLPSNLTLKFKDEVKFIETPDYIVNEKDYNFTVIIGTFSQIIPNHNTIDMTLSCAGLGVLQSWPGIVLNQPASLSFYQPNLSDGPLNCELIASNDYYTGAIDKVVVYIPLTQEEINVFLQRIGALPGYLWYNK